VRNLSTGLLQARDKETEAALRLDRALLLAHMGKTGEARADHMRILEIDPENRTNLLEFGRMLSIAGQKKAARIVYAEAVKKHPGDVVSRVNYGGLLLEAEDAVGAREQFEAALAIDPELLQAHGGMYYALSKLGEAEVAEVHQRRSFGKKSLFKTAYKGSGEPIPVILLLASNGGNTPIEKLLDDRIFETYVVVADFFDERVALPEHELIVNGIGDCDQAEAALLAAERILRSLSAPVINAPAAVKQTRRHNNAVRLSKVSGLRTPATLLLSSAELAQEQAAEKLAFHGLRFPLLLRAPGFHMGQHFVRVESPEVLRDCLADLPAEQLLAIELLDARGADGYARKYRVMMVDGELYPLHLAISADWKIHYFNADMAERPEHRAEERCFLTDMAGVLGDKAIAALREVQATLRLEYGGIDFGLNAAREVLLFEANATMVVEQPQDDSKWNYRRAAVTRIHEAVREMLMRRIGVPA
jgi:tetratricopeptide (TPR) repeat protein